MARFSGQATGMHCVIAIVNPRLKRVCHLLLLSAEAIWWCATANDSIMLGPLLELI